MTKTGTAVPTPLPPGYRFGMYDDTGDIRSVPAPRRYFAEFPFTLVVLDGAGPVGHADFYHAYPSNELMCNDVFVDPGHRKRGLATAMYLEAERLSGKTIHPYTAQYPDGRKLWENPRRPFGRGVPNPTTPVIPEGS